jgi:hypothetical protein
MQQGGAALAQNKNAPDAGDDAGAVRLHVRDAVERPLTRWSRTHTTN